MNDFIKYGAIAILCVIGMGAIMASGNQIIQNTKDISGMKVYEESIYEHVKEIKQDVKALLKRGK